MDPGCHLPSVSLDQDRWCGSGPEKMATQINNMATVGGPACTTYRCKSMTRLDDLVKELKVRFVAFLVFGIASDCLARIIHSCLRWTARNRAFSKTAFIIAQPSDLVWCMILKSVIFTVSIIIIIIINDFIAQSITRYKER